MKNCNWIKLAGFALALWVACLVLLGFAGRHRSPEQRYEVRIRRAAEASMPPEWDWRIFEALVRKESAFDPRAVSRSGALGLCQLMPATAGELGLTTNQCFNPHRCLPAGARYLRRLWDAFPEIEDRPGTWERTRFALAAYNCGPGRVAAARVQAGGTTRWEELKPHLPGQTQQYVERILGEFLPEYQAQSARRFAGLPAGVKPAPLHFWSRQRAAD